MARQSAKYMDYSWELLQRQLLLKRIPLSAFEQVTQLCRAFFLFLCPLSSEKYWKL